ncbi:carbamoyltransferase family protein [Cytobacillus horneckiae]|uniref:carbamoyltransferase family protein n=1 Tax=Cytobacillus horneckiae TaxID=549687 RepID=UPI003D19FD32
MYVLGIGGSEHDFSATLIKDGEILCSIEDERLTRSKYSLQKDLSITPLAKEWRSIQYCLDQADITLNEIDCFFGNDLMNKDYIPQLPKQIVMLNHHLTHAASTYYTSPYNDAAILVVDGIGTLIDSSSNTHETISLYKGTNNEIKDIGKVHGSGIENPVSGWTLFENSIGRFYYRVTAEIGFGFLEEGKTMGLAPYGKETYVGDFKRFYSIDGYIFRQSHEQKLEMVVYIRNVLKNTKDRFQTTADLAYAVQHHLEQIMISICNALYDITQSKNLCLAGGVALNSVANLKVLENTPFENIYVQPASGDAGTSIGAALYGFHVLNNKPREDLNNLFSPYLGKNYSEREMLDSLDKHGNLINIEKPDDYVDAVAKLLTKGSIIAWFNGRSEIGPRALGNRSILVDPRRKDMKDILNKRVKHREGFRPFAPIVLEEYQTEYFELEHPSYYMLLVPKIKIDKQDKIPAVTHADGTGRVQTVSNKLNPQLHALVSSFYKQTGVPVLLNTSFNDNGEPIVESPEDALNCFLKTDIDYLVINGFIISKKVLDN